MMTKHNVWRLIKNFDGSTLRLLRLVTLRKVVNTMKPKVAVLMRLLWVTAVKPKVAVLMTLLWVIAVKPKRR